MTTSDRPTSGAPESWTCLCPEGDVEAGIPCIQCPIHGDGKDTRFPQWPDGCSTPECPGDPRYSAPGRRHLVDCTYPLPAPAAPAAPVVSSEGKAALAAMLASHLPARKGAVCSCGFRGALTHETWAEMYRAHVAAVVFDWLAAALATARAEGAPNLTSLLAFLTERRKETWARYEKAHGAGEQGFWQGKFEAFNEAENLLRAALSEEQPT